MDPFLCPGTIIRNYIALTSSLYYYKAYLYCASLYDEWKIIGGSRKWLIAVAMDYLARIRSVGKETMRFGTEGYGHMDVNNSPRISQA